MKYYLAIDIGASSGRHILGNIENGVLKLEEIYRFDNGFKDENGSLVWDVSYLSKEVINGIKQCKSIGKIPETVAIDTWGVDYVLLDENKKELLPAFCYRDSRTVEGVKKVEGIISCEELYMKTGIQKQNYNTVYQLYCDKASGKLDNAKHMLMMPAYLSFKLTDKIFNEYCECTTSAMVSPVTKDWDDDILSALKFDKNILGTILPPCSLIGEFSEKIQNETGFNAKVIFCPSHDTASAVAACPLEENSLYISSGTWSLIGLESKQAIISDETRILNFANEGGIDYRFRFLKNYMGMWLLQSIRRDLNKSLSYDEMMTLAKDSGTFSYIDVNAQEFVAPVNMIEAIKGYLNKPEMPLGEVINSVYHSLAKSYVDAVNEIERVTGKTVTAIHIVGGGSKDCYLNELTHKYTGKAVTAGPVEATAIGNLISQLIFSDECKTLEEARSLVRASFDIKEV